PALLEALVDDGTFDALDRHSGLNNAQHARAFAGRRTDSARELREIVGLVEPFEGLFPEAAVNQVVPFGDEVVNRAAARHPFDQGARVAERHAAIHAASALFAQLALVRMLMELEPVADALSRRPGHRQLARILQEAGGLTH